MTVMIMPMQVSCNMLS